MARLSMLVLALNGLLLVNAQYGQSNNNAGGNYGGQSNPPPPPPPQQQQQSYGGNSGNQQQQQSYGGQSNSGSQNNYGGQQGGNSNSGGQQSNYGGGQQGGSNSGGNGGGGDLSVQCRATPDGSGKIKYDCSGVNKDAITLRTEHFLWLENQASSSQNLDIEIPNYNLDEFIKAAYKSLGPQEGAKINILLKKPQVTYNAEKDEGKNGGQNAPAVNLNYQPVEKISVHYPTQKAYGNSGGGSSNSGSSSSSNSGSQQGGGSSGAYSQQQGSSSGGSSSGGPGAYSRPQRESGTRYYFIRQP